MRSAVPLLILAAVFLPLPLAIGFVAFAVLLAVWPRGEPAPALGVLSRAAGTPLLRGPPR